jgi:hypothetical protein
MAASCPGTLTVPSAVRTSAISWRTSAHRLSVRQHGTRHTPAATHERSSAVSARRRSSWSRIVCLSASRACSRVQRGNQHQSGATHLPRAQLVDEVLHVDDGAARMLPLVHRRAAQHGDLPARRLFVGLPRRVLARRVREGVDEREMRHEKGAQQRLQRDAPVGLGGVVEARHARALERRRRRRDLPRSASVVMPRRLHGPRSPPSARPMSSRRRLVRSSRGAARPSLPARPRRPRAPRLLAPRWTGARHRESMCRSLPVRRPPRRRRRAARRSAPRCARAAPVRPSRRAAGARRARPAARRGAPCWRASSAPPTPAAAGRAS